MPGLFATLKERDSMAAQALMFNALSASRTSEVLKMRWDELNFEARVWTCPAERMKTGFDHRVPLTDPMLSIVEELRAMKSEVVFEGQKRHTSLSNMSMLMLLRRVTNGDATVHGLRSTFRDWASEVANAPREVAEMSLAHRVGSDVERAYARSDLLEKRRGLMEQWSSFVTNN